MEHFISCSQMFEKTRNGSREKSNRKKACRVPGVQRVPSFRPRTRLAKRLSFILVGVESRTYKVFSRTRLAKRLSFILVGVESRMYNLFSLSDRGHDWRSV
jgi:hypothetical protein